MRLMNDFDLKKRKFNDFIFKIKTILKHITSIQIFYRLKLIYNS